MLTAEQILHILPHRFPMLLVDRILEMEPGVRAVGVKNVTINEPFFAGHWPGQPVMPGVLIVECMAQVAAISMLAHPDHHNQNAFFAGIDKVRFRKPVVPGDTLIVETMMKKIRGSIGLVVAKVQVEGETVAEGEIMFAMLDREKPKGEEN
jgi:3-hydroxyacyl-[acyl-carrier-protein] dehydratase